MDQTRRRWPLLAATLIWLPTVTVLTLAGLTYWVMNAPAVPVEKMEMMRRGMTSQNVRELLGQPSTIRKNSDAGSIWTYSRFTWACYYVFIDEEDRVWRFHHDF